MIKVLGLALYGPLAASTRYRLGQYIPGLTSFGIDLKIRSLLGDNYLRKRYYGGSLPVADILSDTVSRLFDLLQRDKYDVAMLHCELFPLIPGWIEQALIRRPYIYDFDDAFYLKYRSRWFGIGRPILGNKFDSVMIGASRVTAGNSILADYAKVRNPNTFHLPTVVDTTRYLPKLTNRGGQNFTVGWIGSPSTAPYLEKIVAPLSAIGLEGPVRFIVIGGKAPVVPNVTVVELEWSEDTEIDLINSFDVGVMPLPDDEWSRGKCAFKLIQYMACGIPVIASPVGANVEVVSPACGRLASTSLEWANALRSLRDQPKMRVDMGELGRERVVSKYSLHQNLPILAKLLYETIKNK
jgi:glycosyltransferase involved in cell wall biosynthesis